MQGVHSFVRFVLFFSAYVTFLARSGLPDTYNYKVVTGPWDTADVGLEDLRAARDGATGPLERRRRPRI